MAGVKKAVILAGGLGTRFLPLSRVVSKELWPLVDKPILYYLLEELKDSGINEIIFVLPSKQNLSTAYLKKDLNLEKILEKRKKEQALLELKRFHDFLDKFSLSFVVQEKPLGNAHALLQAKTKIRKQPFVLFFCDDLVDAEVPATTQLLKVFKTAQRPVAGLYRVEKEEIPFYGVAAVERIAQRFFKVKGVVEKPKIEEAPSDLAIVGRYILTPDIFDYIETAMKKGVGKNKELYLTDVLKGVLDDGRVIYGYELKGRWLKCGNKLDWLKSQFYLCLKDPRFNEEIKKYLKELIL
jgi:UTP--glucose-1-phosphate uridylyltransferase